MTGEPKDARQSKLRAYRWPLQLIAVGVAAGLWLSGLAGEYVALLIICVPAAVIFNYEWLSRVLHHAPQQ